MLASDSYTQTSQSNLKVKVHLKFDHSSKVVESMLG